MLRQPGHTIFLAFGITHDDLLVGNIDVFHPQADAFHQAQPCTVQEGGHDPCGAREGPQHCSDLVPGQRHREALWLLGAHHFVQPAYALIEDLLTQKTLDASLGPFNQDEFALGRFET